jgi:hypothetical protein
MSVVNPLGEAKQLKKNSTRADDDVIEAEVQPREKGQ